MTLYDSFGRQHRICLATLLALIRAGLLDLRMINYNGAKLSSEKGLRAHTRGGGAIQRDAIKWKAKGAGEKKRGPSFYIAYMSAVQTLIKFDHTLEWKSVCKESKLGDRDLKTPTVYSGMFHFVNDNNIHLSHRVTWE